MRIFHTQQITAESELGSWRGGQAEEPTGHNNLHK